MPPAEKEVIGSIEASYSRLQSDEEGNLEITFRVGRESRWAARRLAKDLKERAKSGKENLSLSVGDVKRKRSLDANAYCWVLLHKLAEATGLPVTEVYRHHVREIGGNSQTVCIPTQGVDKLREGWSHNGLGWVSETFPSKLDGCTNVVLYYGSSTYDTRQMARLIDNILQDCREQGIETLPPWEVERLKEGWR